MNILLITLDQFRGDCLGVAGHPIVQTPHLDRLAREGLRLARHYSQAAPCGPGRACLYTGTYQMNNRVVANGSPLDARFDNIALAARRAGYEPTLFGYTDQAVDPRVTSGPDDARLRSYEGVLPGFAIGCDLPAGEPVAWTSWLRDQGYDVSDDAAEAYGSEPVRPAEVSQSAFLTDRFLDWMRGQTRPWFAHLSQLRPHPPYKAAGHFSTMYDPDAMPDPVPMGDERHWLHDALLQQKQLSAPADAAKLRRIRAQYFGMISEVDHQLGRVWAALEARGQWDETLIVVTADHGEQLGDQGLLQKAGFFEASYHILGIVRDPRPGKVRGAIVDQYTENVDLMPTLCDAMGVAVPAQCDGVALTPFLDGEVPEMWRDAAAWEFDWRGVLIQLGVAEAPGARGLEQHCLAVRRSEGLAYVQFGDGSYRCFDLAADPTWRTEVSDPAIVLREAQAMLAWRARHTDRTLTGLVIDNGVKGRWPAMPAGWGEG
ncbi:Multifunctional alkaline phosphatase superfamily protein [Alphaproteobacteria bacterium SO-S41]|nr:Multifunctional alkaline phosphatase superfamily protein [Alphaproteobacteria bacterium SO-S41]